MSTIPDPFSVSDITAEPERPKPEDLPKPTITNVDPLEMPKVPERGELEHMQALAQQVDWPTLFIEAVPPETWRKFHTLGKGKTDLERLQDLIRQVEYE